MGRCLCADVLLRVPDATPYTGVLRLLTERIVAWREQGRAVPAAFGPGFWAAVPYRPRNASTSSGAWWSPTPAGARRPNAPRTPEPSPARATSTPSPASSSQDPTADSPTSRLVRGRAGAAVDAGRDRRHGGTGAAVRAPSPGAGPPGRGPGGPGPPAGRRAARRAGRGGAVALCRAVDRWARDERPARRVAAVAYGLRAAPFAVTRADRHLLRRAALAVLARPADHPLHGGALGILVRDPLTRARYLPQALERFAAGDPRLPPGTLAAALATHPEPVFAAFRDQLRRPGPDRSSLRHPRRRHRAGARPPNRRAGAGGLGMCPEPPSTSAAYAERRLDHGRPPTQYCFPWSAAC